MEAWVHIGQEMIGKLSFAECCQNCKHCISEDDPIGYACARLSRPKRFPPMVFGPGSTAYHKKCAEVYLWWGRHYVSAGMVCNHFTPATYPKIVQYEDDYTREASR